MCPFGRRTSILFLVFPLVFFSTTPLIRTLVIRIANYPDRLGPSGKHFLNVNVLPFYGLKFSPFCEVHIKDYVLMFYVYVNKYVA